MKTSRNYDLKPFLKTSNSIQLDSRPELVENYKVLKAKCKMPGGPTQTDVAIFLDKITKILNPMKIFLIDIDELECTVFGKNKPYSFGQTKSYWKIKNFNTKHICKKCRVGEKCSNTRVIKAGKKKGQEFSGCYEKLNKSMSFNFQGN